MAVEKDEWAKIRNYSMLWAFGLSVIGTVVTLTGNYFTIGKRQALDEAALQEHIKLYDQNEKVVKEHMDKTSEFMDETTKDLRDIWIVITEIKSQNEIINASRIVN